MKTIYTTPVSQNKRNPFSFFYKLFKTSKTNSHEEIHLARQYVLKIHNNMISKFSTNSTNFDFSTNKTGAVPALLEGIAQNISKIDQNLYCTKNNMEDALRNQSITNNPISSDMVSLN